MRKFILGTDFWTDCDDAVAMRILTKYIKSGKTKLLGIGINACMEYSVASLKGLLMAEGVSGIPIGIDRDATDFGGNPPYQKRLAKRFCPDVTNDEAIDAVRLYRKILANADEKIEIIEIGYPQVLANVLECGADDISQKSGVELFTEKVSKVWVMAGKWDDEGGLENNFCRNPRSRVAASKLCSICPVPMTFLGWETGFDVITGDELEKDDYLYHAMVDHTSVNGRSSWYPMLLLMALIGDEEKAGYKTVCGTATVDAGTGANHFTAHKNGLHRYVIKAKENDFYKKQINELLKR